MSKSQEAMKKVREAGLTKEFMENPVATLKKAGVDTSDLRVHQTMAAEGSTHGGCVSVGCGVCASIG